jgi:hypothetical protein
MLVRFTGAAYSELLESIKSKFSPTFANLPIEELQLFKPNEVKPIKGIEDVNISEYQTEKNPLILRLKPKTIKIDDGLGCITEHELTSQDDLDSIFIEDGCQGLMSRSNKTIHNFCDLKDGQVYRLLVPKRITVFSIYSESTVQHPCSFYSQKDLDTFLSIRDIDYLVETQDIKSVVWFDTIRPEKTYLGRPRVTIHERWYAIDEKTMEEEACSAARAEIARVLRDQNIDETLIDKTEEFKKDGEKLFEWDRIFYVPGNDCLYLIECKHSMRPNLLRQLINRRDTFTGRLQELGLADGKHFKSSYKSIIGIACAGEFPEELKVKAEAAGLLTLTLSSNESVSGTTWVLKEDVTKS